MACKYIYNGKEYSKEELVDGIASGLFQENPVDIFKSVATQKKQKQSNIVRDTVTVLYQRNKLKTLFRLSRTAKIPRMSS
jgi:uncharacterized protein (DUF111 family)